MTRQLQTSILTDTDSYKVSHHLMYPEGLDSMFAYIENRSSKYYAKTQFFGLQYIILRSLEGVVCTPADVEAAKVFWESHGLPFNYDGWMRIATVHGGRLPVRIRALPEGTVVPVHVPLITIESLDPEVPWIASWVETVLGRIWYTNNIATIGLYARDVLSRYWAETSDSDPSGILFQLHDFGSRGVSCTEQAAVGGAAHLLNFRGTDTGVALDLCRQFYGCPMAGYSIPAAEHSTITIHGQDKESEAYAQILRNCGTGPAVAVVSDSYDIFNAAENIWGGLLKEDVIKLQDEKGCKLVIRPDSGDPVEVVTTLLQILEKQFGTTTNSKGFKVLNYTKVIQGDGIDTKIMEEILQKSKELGFSSENLAFGMGGGLLQKHNRDLQSEAMKTSFATVDGEGRDVYKQPVTDPGKNSKRGRLDVVVDGVSLNGVSLRSIRLDDGEVSHPRSYLRTVFESGALLIEETLDTIRQRGPVLI